MAQIPSSYTVPRRATARRVWRQIQAPLWVRFVLALVAFALPPRKRTVEINYNGNGGTT